MENNVPIAFCENQTGFNNRYQRCGKLKTLLKNQYKQTDMFL